jgi:hypothetical protein
MRIQFFHVVLSCALSALPAFAGDLLVDPSAGAPAFTTIQAAINAANVGDRILVAPGLYPERLSISKGIELVGAGPSLTQVRPTQVNAAPFTLAQPPIAIQNLPAGQRLRISGMRCSSQHNGGVLPALAMLVAFDCQGRVELSDLVLDLSNYSPTGFGTFSGTLRLINCAQVVADRVVCINSLQGNPSLGGSGFWGQAPVRGSTRARSRVRMVSLWPRSSPNLHRAAAARGCGSSVPRSKSRARSRRAAPVRPT